MEGSPLVPLQPLLKKLISPRRLSMQCAGSWGCGPRFSSCAGGRVPGVGVATEVVQGAESPGILLEQAEL
jgi:hypothetical protein